MNEISVTIPKGSIDQFYWYKRHTIYASIVSKNGGTTIIHNGDIIAKEIYRTIDDFSFSKKLFIGILGTSVIKKEQRAKNNKTCTSTTSTHELYIRGQYSNSRLEDILVRTPGLQPKCCAFLRNIF